jgi:hypothetical protein
MLFNTLGDIIMKSEQHLFSIFIVLLVFTISVTARAEPPVSDPDGPYSGTVSVSVNFDGTGSYDPDGFFIAFYEWDFGDGSPIDASINPTHSYSTPGLYTVSLTVTDIEGLTDTATTTADIAPTVINMPVDIKPQSCPNPIKLKGKGVLPVAILGTEDFDVTQIDPATVKLSREGVEVDVSPLRWAYKDVATPFEGELCDCHTLGADGLLDLALKFDVPELVEKLELADMAGETIPLILTGNLMEEYDGNPISDGDCVWVLE